MLLDYPDAPNVIPVVLRVRAGGRRVRVRVMQHEGGSNWSLLASKMEEGATS